jgi:ADP-dependent NAD(P)H-hydrate dehydratase / NAD(P)H-hydrate epimerase
MGSFPWPLKETNKHTRGRLAVFAGNEFCTGAARLAANAGARIGAGWVVIFADFDAARIIAAHETSIMVKPIKIERGPPNDIEEFGAIIIGPAFGFDASRYALLRNLCLGNAPIILDADALTYIANSKVDNFFEIFDERNAPVVLTPHSGEFYRLFNFNQNVDFDEKIDQTLAAAKIANAIIVHKGAKTIVATPDGKCATLEESTPFLASAGTGDVLAGLIGGLMAQKTDAFIACQIGVYLHARAGISLGAGLLAQDLPIEIAEILKEIKS